MSTGFGLSSSDYIKKKDYSHKLELELDNNVAVTSDSSQAIGRSNEILG
jgi:hypothetical protein